MGSVLENFLSASQQLKQNTLLDVLVAVNRGCDGCSENIEEVPLLGKLPDILDVLLAQAWLLFLSEETHDARSYDLGSESAPCDTHVHIWSGAVNTSHLDSVTGLDAVHEVVLEDDLHAARKLTWGCALWHLLDCDHLRVLVQAVAILVRQRISVLVFDWERLTAVGRLVLRVGAHLRQVRIVIVVADFALLSGFTVVH